MYLFLYVLTVTSNYDTVYLPNSILLVFRQMTPQFYLLTHLGWAVVSSKIKLLC